LHVPATAGAAAADGNKAGGGSNASSSSTTTTTAPSYYSPRVQFGCADTEDGMLRSQAADGILGLGNSAETVVGQLAGAGATGGAGFGVCLSHPSGGAVLLGASADDTAALARAVGVTGEMRYAPLLRDRHFAVQGGRMLLGGEPILVSAKPPPPGSDAAKKRREQMLGKEVAARLSPAARAIEDSATADEIALWDSYYDAGAPKKDGDPLSLGRTVVDSGATWSYLPFGKAIALERALQRVVDSRPPERAPRLRRLPPDFLPEELCWRAQPEDTPAAAVYSAFPKLTIELSDKKEEGLFIELGPESYLYPLYDVEVPPDSEGARAAADAAAAAAAQAEADARDGKGQGVQGGQGQGGGPDGAMRVPAATAERQRQQQQGQQQQAPAPPHAGSGSPRGRRLHSSSDPPPSNSSQPPPAGRRLTMGDIAQSEVRGVYCLGFMRSAEEWSLLGGAALRGRLTHFDLSRQRLGLATATCRIDPRAVAGLVPEGAKEDRALLKAASGVMGGGGGSGGGNATVAAAVASRAGGVAGSGRRLLSASAGAAVASLMARAAA
jgi:hypothetical protein